jgi:hypothetical protein
MTVLSKFKKRIIQMRKGNNPYKSMLEKIPLSNFSTSSTPALGGMVCLKFISTSLPIFYVRLGHIALFLAPALLIYTKCIMREHNRYPLTSHIFGPPVGYLLLGRTCD